MSAARPLLLARDHLLLAAISLAVLLPGIFRTPLTDRDEGWYAEVSREMLVGGDWVVPHYLGEPWLAKPPLLYWCIAGLFSVFGPHAGAARLVSVLAMSAAVQLLGTLGAALLGRRAGLLAAVAFSTAGLPVIVGKLALTDALLLLCVLGASLALWRVATDCTCPRAPLLLWVWIGLGVLAKGPAVLVFVGAWAFALLTAKDTRGWIHCRWLYLTAPVGVLIAAPWYVLTALSAGEVLRSQLLGFEILSRFTHTPHGHGGPPGYHLVVALAGWLPWSALLPGAVFAAIGAARRDATLRRLVLWWALPWLLLELIASKLPHYTLPAYVPLALLFGQLWDAGTRRTIRADEWRVLGLWAGANGGLGMLIALLGGVWLQGAAQVGAGVAGIGLLLAAAGAWLLLKRRRLIEAFAVTAGGAVCAQAAIGALVLPSLPMLRLSSDIAATARTAQAAQVAELADEQPSIVVSGFDEPSLFFYLAQPVELTTAGGLRAALGAQPKILIASERALTGAGLDVLTLDPRWRVVQGFNYVTGKRVSVWIGPVEATQN